MGAIAILAGLVLFCRWTFLTPSGGMVVFVAHSASHIIF